MRKPSRTARKFLVSDSSATFHLYPHTQRPRAAMGRAGSACSAMASGQKMLKTPLRGRSDWRRAPLLLLLPPTVDSVSSGAILGVSGGDGGSDWNVGSSELVDQMAVRLSNS